MSLSGEAYEAWVAGVDPQSGVPKGRIRHDVNAVRFVEVVVNGPKSWSLAAAIHPDVSAAYDAAQVAAAEQILGWLAQHASTRVGPRGGQVQVPVQELEAAVVRHYTSRAGDPHRHLHVQVNARVRAEGRWCGLHTLGVRDSLEALNGIGHAAVMTDPGFRRALADHGYTLDAATGEITQLREYVGAFSARAAQITANLDRYERGWRAAHPRQEPGPGLRRRWDHAAWNDARPGKITPRDGAELTSAWLAELRALGYRDPAGPVRQSGVRAGEVDRERAVATVLARLGARRSGWNGADVRGEVEQFLARADLVTPAAVRLELAEDLTARVIAECVPLLDRPGLPEQVRALTSRRVLHVEAELTARLARRADTTPSETPAWAIGPGEAAARLDVSQRQVIAAVAGGAGLVVVEGAAGAGKTTTLAAARTALQRQGYRLVVVTPTLKAARVAARQLGTRAFSAAWLAHQHGWRWDQHGSWTRLHPGQSDPATGRPHAGPREEARLRPVDVLLVDEAGMLDQDTARALLQLADEYRARLVLVGDRHQLPAVGRGGVLDLAARLTAPGTHLELAAVHRFTDPDYAALTLAMRTGEHPGEVFDALHAKGLVRLHGSEAERTDALAASATAAAAAIRRGVRGVRVLTDTNEHAAVVNAAVRARRVAAGAVDDQRVITTRAGQRLGVGDVVVTRRNDPSLRVANRDVWGVTHVTTTGEVHLSGPAGTRLLPAGYARQHLELGYAGTVHTAQGDTADHAHYALGEHAGAATAYVALTRGRQTNTVHLVADTLDTARQTWVETFRRDQADLGPAIAARRARVDAARYAPHRPLEQALTDLRAAWSAEADTAIALDRAAAGRDRIHRFLTLAAEHQATLGPLETARQHAARTAAQARQRAQQLDAVVADTATGYADQLHRHWAGQRPAARDAARTVLDGPGRLGRHRRAVHQAEQTLQRWAERWRPILPDLPADTRLLARLAHGQDTPTTRAAISAYAHAAAEHAHPEHHRAVQAARQTAEQARQSDADYRAVDAGYQRQLADFGALSYATDPHSRLHDAEHRATAARRDHDSARTDIDQLVREPALRTLPTDRLQAERARWQHDRDTQAQAQAQAQRHAAARAGAARTEREQHHLPSPGHSFPAPVERGRGVPR